MTYTEDALVEQPAIKLFDELGWDTLNCWDEIFGDPHPNPLDSGSELRSTPSIPGIVPRGEGVYLGRENRGDVVLVNRLRIALEKHNPDSPKLAIDEAIEELTRDI